MMDRAEAIFILNEEIKALTDGYTTYLAHGGKPDPAEEVYIEAHQLALAALREQEQSNEPLTLEELCQMNGEPAYCAEYDGWGIVNVEIAGHWNGKPFLGGYSRGISFNYDIKMRGLTLYRHKPKEGAD